MDPRLAKYFLRRLRHRAEADAIDGAVSVELLIERQRIVVSQRVRSFGPGPVAAGRSQAEIIRMLGKLARSGSISRTDPHDDEDVLAVAARAQKWLSDQADKNARSKNRAASRRNRRSLDATWLLRAVRRSARPPRATEVATLLLVADAIGASGMTVRDVQAALGLPAPIVTITGRVPGFEETFIDLLCRGLVLPGTVATCKGYELRRYNGFRFHRSTKPRWRVIAFEGERFDADALERIETQIGIAADSGYPILGTAEKEDGLPDHLRQAARLNLTCGPITMEIVHETMRAVLGEVPERDLDPDLAAALTLCDLALAIRPGAQAGTVLDLLEDLAQHRLKSAAGVTEGGGNSSDKKSSRTPKRGAPGSGGQRIEPAVLTGTQSDRFIPRVETLTGYGEAQAWALNLKDDLALWRAGTLGWQDMSAKLLLSGPPGTGKTIFARALSNTLQVPLIATSVARWMEPGYLGDVLLRMSAAFAEAEAARPCILFIDELDGINKRGSSGEWTTYWDSIVNRLLELLDGSARSDGVIVVGATNNPDMIDEALLRSGRLEKHVVVPRPDTEALIGILRHHLKDDLDAVIASAPQRPADHANADQGRSADGEARSAVAGDPPETRSRKHFDNNTGDKPTW